MNPPSYVPQGGLKLLIGAALACWLIAAGTAEAQSPNVSVSPINLVTNRGSEVVFAALATGSPPLSYQWRKNGVNIGGATASSLLLTNVDVPDVGRYSAWVTNAYGSALSEPAILTLASLDLIYASCKDSVGNLYVVGRTCAPDFPVTPGAYCTNSMGGLDAFVAKFDTNMSTLLACTLLGGEGDDEAHSVAVVSAGNVWVAGDTKSSTFPVTSGAYQAPEPLGLRDIFVTKLNSNLTAVLASTRLGGDNYDANFAIGVNVSGDVYVAGQTDSLNFPTTAGAYATTNSGRGDGFVLKLSSDLSILRAATFLGGTNEDLVYRMALSPLGKVYVAGQTRSGNFPTILQSYDRTPGQKWDGFVARFNTYLTTLESSTLLGYDDNDCIYDILLDTDGSVVLAGETYSSDFPTTSGAFCRQRRGEYDAFVMRLNAGLTSLLASTLLGGNDYDTAYALARASDGKIIVAGDTYSTNFPVSATAVASASSGSCDVFVAQFDPGLTQLVSGSVLGGSADEFLYALFPVSDTLFVLVGDSYSQGFSPHALRRGTPDLALMPAWMLSLDIVQDLTPGALLRWPSMPQQPYFIDRSTNLGRQPVFSLLCSNIIGNAGYTTFKDTNATGPGPWFYRLGVNANQ